MQNRTERPPNKSVLGTRKRAFETLNVLLRMMKGRRTIGFVAALLALYVGVYVVLSIQGTYVPLAWGLGWVKWYAWAPRGFAAGPAGTDWHRTIVYSFLPLWELDRHFWHTEDRMYGGKYPVNKKLDDALQRGRQQNQASEAIDASASQPQR